MSVNAAPMPTSNTVIFDEFGMGSGVSGVATLTRSPDGLSLSLGVENLVEGDAHTVWWIIFGNASGCDDGCGADDLGRRSAQVTVVNGGGFVADAGLTEHLDDLARHDVGARQVLLGSSLRNPYKAEVHVIVRTHGGAPGRPSGRAPVRGYSRSTSTALTAAAV